MKQKYLHLLKFLSIRDSGDETVHWTFEGMTDEDVEYLTENEYITVSLGEGYTGGILHLHLTPKGQDFIESFCEVCECMPCDCDYGY